VKLLASLTVIVNLGVLSRKLYNVFDHVYSGCPMPDTSNLDISRRIQEKFEFYFLSLTFIILGLSIQTSEFGTYIISDSLELLAWISLFISGMSGLSRMRWVPSLYKVKDEIIRRERYRDDAKQRKSVGEDYIIHGDNKKKPIDDFINDVSQGVKDVQGQLNELEVKNNFKYRLHIYGFTVGLFFLIGSRGYEPIAHLVNRLIQLF